MAYSAGGGDRSHTNGHMIEPMQPDLAEAVRPLSAAEQLAARVAGQPMPRLHIEVCGHRFGLGPFFLRIRVRAYSAARCPTSGRARALCAVQDHARDQGAGVRGDTEALLSTVL
jgi:hypothetical protein